MTTHGTHNRQISMPPVRFESTISAGERPVAARLLRSWVRIPPGAWIFVCCECRVLSGRGLCDELITRPEDSCRLCCVVVCDLETSRMGAPYIYDISRLRVNAMCYRSLRVISDKHLGIYIFQYIFISILQKKNCVQSEIFCLSQSLFINNLLLCNAPAGNSVCYLPWIHISSFRYLFQSRILFYN